MRIKFSIVADFIIPEIAWSSTEQQNLETDQRRDKRREKKTWILLAKFTPLPASDVNDLRQCQKVFH